MKTRRKEKVNHIQGKTTTGPGFKELGCDCPVPPWEECENYQPATRTCRLCGEPVLIRSVAGKITTVDPGDRKRHWFTCMMARKARAA